MGDRAGGLFSPQGLPKGGVEAHPAYAMAMDLFNLAAGAWAGCSGWRGGSALRTAYKSPAADP